MRALDTNVVVRFIVNDEPKQSEKARSLLERAPILLVTEVLLEVDWVLRSVYGFSREKVASALETLCGLPGVVLSEPNVVEAAIASYEFGVEFSDAVFVHSAAASGASAFVTFDRDLIKRAPRAVTDIKVEAP